MKKLLIFFIILNLNNYLNSESEEAKCKSFHEQNKNCFLGLLNDSFNSKQCSIKSAIDLLDTARASYKKSYKLILDLRTSFIPFIKSSHSANTKTPEEIQALMDESINFIVDELNALEEMKTLLIIQTHEKKIL